MRRATRERWQNAANLLELGELTALWLEGKIESQPGYEYNVGPDDETEPLIPVLAKLNRAGFVTNCSQPGWGPDLGNDKAVWCQRAAVSGMIHPNRVDLLTQPAAEIGLTAQVVMASSDESSIIPVTTRAAENYTWFGARLDHSDIGYLYEDCGPAGIAALQAAAQVTLVDPEWGRVDSPLWPLLESAADALAATQARSM